MLVVSLGAGLIAIICSVIIGVDLFAVMESSRKQVLFLVDAGFLGRMETQELRKQHSRAVCLACCRILLHLSGFPSMDTVGRVKWSYELLRSEAPDISAQSRVRRFQDVRSELLEDFYKDLEERICGEEGLEAGFVGGPAPSIQTNVIYNGLASVVQDCLWEAPELTSPVRPRGASKSRRGRQRRSNIGGETSSCGNLIFLISWLPRNQTEVDLFCGQQGTQLGTVKEKMRGDMLPGPLISQLIKKDIALQWVEPRISWKGDRDEVCYKVLVKCAMG